MIFLPILLALVRLAASTFDQDLDDKFNSMPLFEFIDYFNKQNYTWKITYYAELEGKDLFGAFVDNKNDFEVICHNPDTFNALPDNFDSRDKWSQCQSIKEIYSQGDCGSCWTFGTATVASDRTCIHKNLTVRLSEQDFQCMQPNVCDGGISAYAFEYWRNNGLVTQICKPYNVDELIEAKPCVQECIDKSIDYNTDKHYAKNVYQIPNDDASIRAELFTNGPIQAAFRTYGDFRFYRSGIYEHKFSARSGGHSVRVVGYGVENGVEYWLVANSWQSTWGENGYVKIKRYQDDLGFEDRLYAGIPKN